MKTGDLDFPGRLDLQQPVVDVMKGGLRRARLFRSLASPKSRGLLTVPSVRLVRQTTDCTRRVRNPTNPPSFTDRDVAVEVKAAQRLDGEDRMLVKDRFDRGHCAWAEFSWFRHPKAYTRYPRARRREMHLSGSAELHWSQPAIPLPRIKLSPQPWTLSLQAGTVWMLRPF